MIFKTICGLSRTFACVHRGSTRIDVCIWSKKIILPYAKHWYSQVYTRAESLNIHWASHRFVAQIREKETHTHTHTQSTIFNNIVFYSCTVQLDTNRIWCLKPAGTIFLCAHIQFQKCFGWQTLLLYKWIAPSNIQAP